MLPKNTKVIVIGGGIAGCSTAYHLAKFGWKDVILLERDQLTSGTTWHAAGLVSQLGPTAAVTKIRKYTTDLYKDLEKKIMNLDRQFLHAVSLGFTHPTKNKRMNFKSKLPNDLVNILKSLRNA